MFEVYKPSGGIGVLTWPLLVVGVVIMLVLSVIYALLLNWIPFIYVNALLTLGMGMAVGAIATFIIKTGHCRNVALGTLVGLLLAVAGLGGKFVTQYYLTFQEGREWLETTNEVSEEDRPLALAAFDQGYTFQAHLKDRIDTGWSIGKGGGGDPIGGWLVYAVWLIEAGIVFYFAWTMSRAAVKEPYSEKMSLWADESESVMLLPITGDEMVRKIQAATTVDQLLEIPIPKTDESAKLTKEVMLVENAILSTEQRTQLVENAELLNEAMNEFRASVEAERLAEQSAAAAE